MSEPRCLICDAPLLGKRQLLQLCHNECFELSDVLVTVRSEMEHLSRYVRYNRKRLGDTTRSAAEKTGIPAPLFNQLEHGRYVPRADQWTRLLAWSRQPTGEPE